MHKYIDVARLVGTKGLGGRAILSCSGNFAELLTQKPAISIELHIVPPVFDSPRTVNCLSAQELSNGNIQVELSEIDSAAEIDKLMHCHFLCEEEKLYALGYRDNLQSLNIANFLSENSLQQLDFFDETLIGWDVIDAKNNFEGKIVGCRNNSGQLLLEVNDTKGNSKEILLPLVDEFIVDVDGSNQVINMSFPSGLLEL